MDFYKQNFLSPEERTKDRLDAIADDHGGVIGTLMDGSYGIRGDEWDAHGYRARWVATQGVGNSGSLVLFADKGTPEHKRLSKGQAKRVEQMLAQAGGPEAVLRSGGRIYDGRERMFPKWMWLSEDWAAVASSYIPFPSTESKTKVCLVPLSEEAKLLAEHAQYERVLDRIEEEVKEITWRKPPSLPALWKLVQLAKLSIGNLRHGDDLLLVAAMNYHIPESAWDRTSPTSNAGMEAWSTRWAARCPFKLADWPLVKELLAKARGI